LLLREEAHIVAKVLVVAIFLQIGCVEVKHDVGVVVKAVKTVFLGCALATAAAELLLEADWVHFLGFQLRFLALRKGVLSLLVRALIFLIDDRDGEESLLLWQLVLIEHVLQLPRGL